MATVDFDAFDADNHYYEATDAFTRHLPANRSRLVTWATINGKPRMVVDNKVFRFIESHLRPRSHGPVCSTSTSGKRRRLDPWRSVTSNRSTRARERSASS
jgi:hypothetical protein